MGRAVAGRGDHVLARMAWMARERPDVFAATRHVLSPKDYCLRALTGNTISTR